MANAEEQKQTTAPAGDPHPESSSQTSPTAKQEDPEEGLDELSEALNTMRRDLQLKTKRLSTNRWSEDGESATPVAKTLKEMSDDNLVDAFMTSVWLDWHSLELCPDSLRANRELVITAVQRSEGEAFQFASESLRCDKDFVLEAMRVNGLALMFAARELREDRAFIMQAVQRDGLALKYASEAIQGDRDVVLAAVQQNGGALVYASEELLADFELLLEATNEDMRSNQLAHEKVVERNKAQRSFLTESQKIAREEEERHTRMAVHRAQIVQQPNEMSEYDELLQSFEELGAELNDMQAAHDKRMEKFAHLDFI